MSFSSSSSFSSPLAIQKREGELFFFFDEENRCCCFYSFSGKKKKIFLIKKKKKKMVSKRTRDDEKKKKKKSDENNNNNNRERRERRSLYRSELCACVCVFIARVFALSRVFFSLLSLGKIKQNPQRERSGEREHALAQRRKNKE